MSTLVSITVTVNDGIQDHTFNVDIDTNCALFWNKEGWQVLEDYYVMVKPDPEKAKQVSDRTCPKAISKDATATTIGDTALIALKSGSCDPTQWP
jgi:hypothetical protein